MDDDWLCHSKWIVLNKILNYFLFWGKPPKSIRYFIIAASLALASNIKSAS